MDMRDAPKAGTSALIRPTSAAVAMHAAATGGSIGGRVGRKPPIGLFANHAASSTVEIR